MLKIHAIAGVWTRPHTAAMSSFRPSKKFLQTGSKPDWLGPSFPKSMPTVKTANSHSQSPVAQQKQRPTGTAWKRHQGNHLERSLSDLLSCLLAVQCPPGFQLLWSVTHAGDACWYYSCLGVTFPPADNLLLIFLWEISIKLIGSPRKKIHAILVVLQVVLPWNNLICLTLPILCTF